MISGPPEEFLTYFLEINMKKLLFIVALALSTNAAFAKTLCSFYCANHPIDPSNGKTMGFITVTHTLYTSDNDNVFLIMFYELGPHCAKVSPGSKPTGIFYYNENLELDTSQFGIVSNSSCVKL